MRYRSVVCLSLAWALVACGRGSRSEGRAQGGPGHAGSAAGSAASGTPPVLVEPVSLRGQALALSADEATLIVADEDHEALFLLPPALSGPEQVRVVPLPGPPAQIVALAERVYVTVRTLPTAASRSARDVIRGPVPTAEKVMLSLPLKAPSGPHKRNTPAALFDPSVVRGSQGGLLLAFRPEKQAGLVEVGRTLLAPDAWGLAVTADQKRALVTSAWSAQVSLVDLQSMKLLATAKTAREPRGIAILPDGKSAYLSHLMGSALTHLELGPDSVRVSAQPLPSALARAPVGSELEASLGYDLVLAPDAQSLYVPRHALGAEGVASWWGAPTVDILDLASLQPIAPSHQAGSARVQVAVELRPPASWEAHPGQAPVPEITLVQPRALAYRRTRDTLLIASEGADALTEVDALAADPAMVIVRSHTLGAHYDPFGKFPERGGAPTGIALSRDERFAYVYCRSTFDVARVELDNGEQRFSHLADDGLPADAAYGRRLFSNATNSSVSGGLACGSCHPEGRDDGYVWREGKFNSDPPDPAYDNGQRFLGRRENFKPTSEGQDSHDSQRPPLYPRQTPLLAGRMRANGPFGWHGENPDILARLLAGFHLHRAAWDASDATRDTGENVAKIDYLADYLRSGLLPPPTLAVALSPLEEQGKALFESTETGCTRCHAPKREFTDRGVTPLRQLPARAGFEREEQGSFKTPSLWFVGGTPPYLHDGSAATLEDLLRTNGDRMGNTKQLSEAERTALAAYLRVL